MKIWLKHLQLMLFVVLLVGPSEEFFFDPKKALLGWFQSLKAKKQQPKTNIHHFHLHYVPAPLPIVTWRAVDKSDLERLYDDVIRSFMWLNYRYRYLPEPSIIGPSITASSGFQQLWGDLLTQETAESENVDSTIDRKSSEGILIQIPVNQHSSSHLLKKLRKQDD